MVGDVNSAGAVTRGRVVGCGRIVADSRKFTGWQARWANLYNESHFWFALITVIILPVTALILGRVTGWFMARLGINLKSRELAEH